MTDAVTPVSTYTPSMASLSLLNTFMKRGPNTEYSLLDERLGKGIRRQQTNVWQFIRDAVDGTGGFTDGRYLYPFRLETENLRLSKKLVDRMDQADYDNFTRDIVNAPWDQIVQSKDLISRKSDNNDINSFWMSVDGEKTAIMDFNEFPMRQSSMYGTAFVFMDRPAVEIATEADDENPSNEPYCYAVHSEHVVDWHFEEDGTLDGMIVVEPTEEGLWDYSKSMSVGAQCLAAPHNLRIWTPDEWALYRAEQYEAPTEQDRPGTTRTTLRYEFVDAGPNELGEIPVVMLYHITPPPKKMFGPCETIDICRVAQTVFNIDSEYREIERKCALFLAMAVKNVQDYADKKVELGQDNLFLYDGDAGKPEWITPDLHSLDKLEKHRVRLIEECYAMAHLRVLVGNIQTKSGFHAEVEFQKTERRIAHLAAQMELFEMRLTRLYCLYKGIPLTDKLFEIRYPREYGVRDVERQLQLTEVLVTLDLGDESNKEALLVLFKTLYPRKSNGEIKALVDSAVKSLAQAKADQKAMALGGAAGGKSGQTGPTSAQRLQNLIQRRNDTNIARSLNQPA